jgi:hypothetical protein
VDNLLWITGNYTKISIGVLILLAEHLAPQRGQKRMTERTYTLDEIKAVLTNQLAAGARIGLLSEALDYAEEMELMGLEMEDE